MLYVTIRKWPLHLGYQTLGPLSVSAVATLTKLENFGREVGIIKTSFAVAPLVFYPIVGELLKVFGWRGPFGFIFGAGKYSNAIPVGLNRYIVASRSLTDDLVSAT